MVKGDCNFQKEGRLQKTYIYDNLAKYKYLYSGQGRAILLRLFASGVARWEWFYIPPISLQLQHRHRYKTTPKYGSYCENTATFAIPFQCTLRMFRPLKVY